MTELEKLVNDAVNVCSRNNDAAESFEEGFVMGFQKAREMAANEANENAIKIEYDDYIRHQKVLDTQYNMACWEIALRIKKLGESEVPE